MRQPFDNINKQEKQNLLKDLEANSITFEKNELVLKKVKNNNFIGIIIYGLIQIIKTDYNGNRIIIEELEENEIFGSKISSLNNAEYSIITKEDTKIIIFDYYQILNKNSKSNSSSHSSGSSDNSKSSN